MGEKRMDFCTNCRKETAYSLETWDVKRTIREKEYIFHVTTAVCSECGGEVSLSGLIDQNVREMDAQYREMEGLVSIDDIKKLMSIYNIGKAPLSLVLGFGEITITRYLAGQVPSKEYSDVIRSVLSSPENMQKKLTENREKIAPAAYHKAMKAAEQMKELFSVSDKMLRTISYLFRQLGEVTPLALQKLLYFVQGESYALLGRPMFSEDCQAWVHGPVYPRVYNLFRDFKYNPIEDSRFAILEGLKDGLTEEERRVIDLVVNTFGEYGGKTLERITHNEEPWKVARDGYGESIPSTEPISKESIRDYYVKKNGEFDFSTEAGLREYIRKMLECGA